MSSGSKTQLGRPDDFTKNCVFFILLFLILDTCLDIQRPFWGQCTNPPFFLLLQFCLCIKCMGLGFSFIKDGEDGRK